MLYWRRDRGKPVKREAKLDWGLIESGRQSAYGNVIPVPGDGIAQSLALVFVEEHGVINEGVVGFDTA
jgi:hypothetical protein